ncbi:hypothetical protein TNCV_4465491 [Trichonephila clavipes]|nr:hypothetical protein TNCV_4465491 [Trichonephila clavipes]
MDRPLVLHILCELLPSTNLFFIITLAILQQYNDSSTVTTEFLQSEAAFLEKMSRIPTLKTTCGNRRKRKNVARELTQVQKDRLLRRQLTTEVVKKV